MKPYGRALVVAVLALAISNAFFGIASLPLDSHEVFVVQTAQEMHDRASWIVPYFNDQPRLNKPPLSYWLTAIAAALTPGPFDVQPWHGRLPSALSGILLVLLTARLGSLLFGPSQSWLAAAIAASSSGYLAYTHSARPEMLYSMLCTGSIVSFASAWKARDDPRRTRTWAHAQWLCFGLATLAKGPHVPALLLAGFVLVLATRRTGWKESLRILQPLTGILLGIGVPLVWFLLVNQRLQESGGNGLADSQLSGSLYRFDWREALWPHYAVSYPLLFMPWLALFPCLLWLRRPTLDPAAKLLALLILATLVPLNFAMKRHGYYALPLLAPGAVLLAAGAIAATRAFADRAAAPAWWRWSAPMHLALTLGLLVYTAARSGSAGAIVAGALAGVLGLCLFAARNAGPAISPAAAPLVTIAICLGTISVALTATQSSWSRTRFDRVHTALTAKEFVKPDDTLAALGTGYEILMYYTRHKVVHCKDRAELLELLRRAPDRSVVLVISKDKMDLLTEPITWTTLGPPGDGKESVLSVRLDDAATAR